MAQNKLDNFQKYAYMSLPDPDSLAEENKLINTMPQTLWTPSLATGVMLYTAQIQSRRTSHRPAVRAEEEACRGSCPSGIYTQEDIYLTVKTVQSCHLQPQRRTLSTLC